MHVTIIAKSPVAGVVKTRLCPPCTIEQAAHIATAALMDSFREVERVAQATDARCVLLLDGDVQEWMPRSFDVVKQRGNGLEERLRNGFEDLGPGVIVGMETPHVIGSLIDAVSYARQGVDTIGLAVDGGYWMIGLCAASVERIEHLFAEVPMGRSHTGISQLRRMHAHGCAVRMLPMARDVDTIDDLRAVASSNRAGELVATAKKVLASLG